TRFERQLDVVDEHGAAPVEDPAADAEHALDRRDELCCGVDEGLQRRRSGTVSKPIARSSAWPMRKSVFSPNCRPTSCRPTGSPLLRPHGIERPGSPAMHDGIVSRSERYIAR